jgi:hypothetical protein
VVVEEQAEVVLQHQEELAEEDQEELALIMMTHPFLQ